MATRVASRFRFAMHVTAQGFEIGIKLVVPEGIYSLSYIP